MTPRTPKLWPHKFAHRSIKGCCYRVMRRHRQLGVSNGRFDRQVRRMLSRYGRCPVGSTISRRRQQLAETPGYEVAVERVKGSIFRYTSIGDIYFE